MESARGIPTGKKIGSVTLYDAGGWYLLVYLGFAAVLGSLIDYGWNFLVLHLVLRRLSPGIKTLKKLIYTLFITIIGFAIDWLYYRITWGEIWQDNLCIEPLFPVQGSHPLLEVTTILAPMLVLAVANYILSRLYLKLEVRQAAILSAVMAFLTAPWIIVFIVLVVQAN
ncbi:hypothetical protein ACFLUX_03250 [Chloroflexota bacterium]